MKLNTLKQRIIAEFVRRAQAEPTQQSDDSYVALISHLGASSESTRGHDLQEALQAGRKAILDWDVRNIGKLLKLFPGAAPRLAGKKLRAYVMDNRNSDWAVCLAA